MGEVVERGDMTAKSEDSDRVPVTTYVPEYQKSEWETHASELEMSQAEFVRSMVQAGRRGFGDANTDSPDSSGSNPGGKMEETVLQALENRGDLSWDQLLDAIAEDLEERLEEAIVNLQEDDRIAHQPRDGTYTTKESQ